MVEILANELREPPSGDFRVVVLLPAKPNNGADTTRGQLGVLASADNGAGRFLAATLSARSGRLTGPLYVHAKIGIVDDTWLTVGSANLNERVLQRHRNERRDLRLHGPARDTIAALGPSIWSARSRRSQSSRPESSMRCGARSPRIRQSEVLDRVQAVGTMLQ